MAVDLILDEPDRVFRPGDRITGRCVMHYVNRASSSAVDLTLDARAITVFGWGSTDLQLEQGSVPLLSSTLSLRDYDDSQPGMRIWHFALPIPSLIQLHEELIGQERLKSYWSTFKTANSFPASSEQHRLPLPPTFSHEEKNGARKKEAKVIYTIGVTDSEAGHAPSFSPISCVLKFRPPSRPTSDDTQNINEDREIRDARLVQEIHEQAKPSKASIKSLFKSSSTPVFSFRLYAYCQKETDLAGPVPFTIQVRPWPEKSSTPSVPPVHVESLSMKLSSLVSMRIDETFSGVKRSLDTTIVLDKTIQLQKKLEEAKMYRHTECIAFPSDAMVSSFHTPNIIQSYTVSMKWTLRCCGHPVEIRGLLPLKIMPLGLVREEQLPIYPPPNAAEHAPPSYKEAVQ